MKKLILVYILCTLFVIISGCSAKLVLPTHSPKALLKLQADSVFSLPSFSGKEIILQIEADLTVCPTGTYLQKYDNKINPVMQTYLTVKPGYVLFEKIAEVFEKQNMHVYRVYTPDKAIPANLNNLIILKLRIDDLEMHFLRTKHEGDYFLGRSNITFSIINQKDSKVPQQIQVRAKTTGNKDIFTEMAGQFILKVSNQL